MELIFVFLASAVLGLLTRYLMPRRLLTGAALVPTAVTATACVLWEGMLWVGLVASIPLVSWLVVLVGATVAGVALNIWLTRSRLAADHATLSRAA
jgi:hypothetical protein